MDTMMGIFKGKSQTTTYPCKQAKAGMLQFLVAPCLCAPETRFYLATHLLMHLRFLSFVKEDLGVCCCHFICAFSEFWMIDQKSRAALQHRSTSTAPFQPQVFTTFPSFLTLYKQFQPKPVSILRFISTKHVHTSYKLLPTHVGSSRWVCQTHKVTACLTFSEWSVVLIYTYKKHRGSWALLPSAQKTVDLRRKRLHLAMAFAKTPVWCADLTPARLVGLAN